MTLWDQRYATEEYQYGTEANDFLRSVAMQLPIGKTLCLAEGEGRNAVYLAGLGHAVTAVDASQVGLQKAHQLAQRRKVEIRSCVADLEDFHIAANSWDCVVSIFCHIAGSSTACVPAGCWFWRLIARSN